jgi:hypothetical protein
MRGVIALMLEHHPYRVLANLGEVFRRCFLRHGSSLSKSGPLAGPVRLTVNLLETVTQILTSSEARGAPGVRELLHTLFRAKKVLREYGKA